MVPTDIDAEAIDEERVKCEKLREEEKEILGKIEIEIQKMLYFCGVQKNVNGLKYFQVINGKAGKKHKKADISDDGLK